ncbi:MAG: hypothetical protein F6K41_13425, partial [Symploca sp. SIO3E6]|nr:hypothetical protein [Caldora sp. SIO3E6]
CRELTANGGNRAFLDYRIGPPGGRFFTAEIPRRTTIQVYAEVGETLNLGSSAIGFGAGAINVTDPDGVQIANPCGAGEGTINNRAEEVAGPGAGGYIPCDVPVNETGIWTVEFVSPDSACPNANPNPDDIGVGVNWVQTDDDCFIAAWDVTVLDGVVRQPGRAYATYLPLNLGANNVELNSVAYIQTKRGDLFRVGLNGIDPFGFIFFANNKGFTDAVGEPLFESVLEADAVFHRPDEADIGDEDITHKIFFNPPSGDLPPESTVAAFGNTFLKPPTPDEPEVSTLTFTGFDGTPGNADPTRGGNFSFTTNEAGRYLITVDVNRDGVLGNANDVVLRGRAVVGTNTVFWDGTDGNGNQLPAGETAYNASFSMIIGDVHFPFLDPENHDDGLIIERVINDNNGGVTPVAMDPGFVYFNDSNLGGGEAVLGVDSLPDGAHDFAPGFGDIKGIDTWTSLVRPDLLVGLIKINKADLTIQKDVNAPSFQAGSPITYTLTVGSLTNDQANPALIPPDTFTDIEGATVTDNIPDTITNVTWTCAPVDAATAACGAASGSGNDISLTVDLDVGAEAIITINGTISPLAAGGDLSNTATIDPPPDTFDPTRGVTDPDPNNNTSTQTITIIPGPIQPVGIKSSKLLIDADGDEQPTPGDTLEYTVIYRNNDGTRNVTEFLARDTIDTSLVTFVPGSYTFAAANGAVVTANPTFNGSTDNNLTNPTNLGTLPPGGSEITMTYQVTINSDVPVGTEIMNQAVATSTGGTLENVVTDASAGTGDITQIPDDGVDTGNLPDTGDDEPTIVIVGGDPTDPTDPTDPEPTNLVLVKRITNAEREGVPIPGINLGTFVDDPNDTNDNLPGWSGLSTGAPVGVSQLDEPLASGDVVEYTIYFLAEGGTVLENVRLCDPIPDGTVFVPNGFAGNSGIALNMNGTTSNITNAADADQGQFFSPLAPVDSPPCPNSSEPQGAVLVNLGSIVPISPSNVGFVRFRIRIE